MKTRMPSDFPEQITFNYLFDKCWFHIKQNLLKIFLYSLFYIIFSLILIVLPALGPNLQTINTITLIYSLVPITTAILGHFTFFGLIYSMNEYRLGEKFFYTDLFWAMKDYNRAKNIFMLTIPFIPLIIFAPIFYFFKDHLTQNYFLIAVILLILLSVYIFFILIVSTFVFVIENKDYMDTLKRSHQIIKGHFIDLFIIVAWILLFNIIGIITVFGIVLTAPLSAMIMLELCRYLIRKYELKDLIS